jgi:hypothetical protein
MSMNDVNCTYGTVFGPEDGRAPHIDDGGEEYRRLYFFRASLHTLTEVHNAISGLRNNREFRKTYRRFDTQFYTQLVDYLSKLDRNLNELRRIRNALGGHVSREGVKRALETMDFGETGKLDIGQKVKDTHYGFAGTICATILLQDIPKKKREEYLLKISRLNLETMEVISNILTAYAFTRRLI